MGYLPVMAFAKFDRSKPHLNVGTIGKWSNFYLKNGCGWSFKHFVCFRGLTSCWIPYPCQFIFNNNKIGHIDHGKTTLTAAITKYLANKGKHLFLETLSKFVKIILETLRHLKLHNFERRQSKVEPRNDRKHEMTLLNFWYNKNMCIG